MVRPSPLKCTDEKNALQRFQNAADDLLELEKLSRLRLKLIVISMWLAVFGTVLTISVAEICRFGYIPTEEEIQVVPAGPDLLTLYCTRCIVVVVVTE
jgi:hypothetical protein